MIAGVSYIFIYSELKDPPYPYIIKKYLLMSITGSGENEDAVHAGSKIKVIESKY